MPPIIRVENLVKKYKKADKNAVDGISFTISQGEFFALLGPNGAGKTTTLSILTTTLAKTSGQITIAGYDLDRQSEKVRQSIGVIFQKPSLDQNLTAEENIRFHSVLYGLYPFRPSFALMPEAYKKQVKELTHLLEIENEIFKPIKSFSGGMKRKLEIIRSLMHHPKVLFLDEPTSGLDPISRKNLWDYLTEIRRKESTTIFLTTHYLEEAEDATHVGVINTGKIVMLGTPTQIKNQLIKEYILVDAKERKKLIAELQRKKMSFEENEHIKVLLQGKSAQAVIKHIDTNLSLLRTHTPTLEEAYFEIIGGKNESN